MFTPQLQSSRRTIVVLTFLCVAGELSGCSRAPSVASASEESGEATQGDEMNSAGSSSPSSDDASGSTGTDCNDDLDCPDPSPFCELGVCGECDYGARCSERDPGRPYCDVASGACVECVPDAECEDLERPVCDDGECRGCMGGNECDTGLCDLETGRCVDSLVGLRMTLRDLTSGGAPALPGEALSIESNPFGFDPESFDGVPGNGPGLFEFYNIPPQTLYRVSARAQQDPAATLPAPLMVTVSYVTPSVQPIQELVAPSIPYARLATLAYDCAPDRFESLADATGADGDGFNDWFLIHSSLVGHRNVVAGHSLSAMDRNALWVDFEGRWNSHDSSGSDGGPFSDRPPVVCWLRRNSAGDLEVDPVTVSDSEWFLFAGARNPDGLGVGDAVLHVPGVANEKIQWRSSGESAWIEVTAEAP